MKQQSKVPLIALAILIFFGGAWVLFTTITQTEDSEKESKSQTTTAADESPEQEASQAESTISTSPYEEDYELIDEQHGTTTTVTLANGVRTIVTNALPNHETGEFPNDGNPNTISAQNLTYEFPLTPVLDGTPTFAREPGVAINGVKFEPQTAERVECSSGESYSVEAIQDFVSLGLDFNNAHVQPTGHYHYHGVSEELVGFADGGSDLVHVGFAQDGHLMYYSKSGAFSSGYSLSEDPRTGSDCSLSLGPQSQDVDIAGTAPDGTYVSDWEFEQSQGDLDECNGATVDGKYIYLLTDEYPFIPRCLMGEFSESGGAPGGGEPAGTPQGPPSQGGSGPPPQPN